MRRRSALGVRQETLAVRKFSKCGRPDQVYRYQHIDAAAVIGAVTKVLAETATESVVVSRQAYDRALGGPAHGDAPSWQELADPPQQA